MQVLEGIGLVGSEEGEGEWERGGQGYNEKWVCISRCKQNGIIQSKYKAI